MSDGPDIFMIFPVIFFLAPFSKQAPINIQLNIIQLQYERHRRRRFDAMIYFDPSQKAPSGRRLV